jgi:predicted tellurium resistance membrane protein TerC
MDSLQFLVLLLIEGLLFTTIDLDNAMYATSVVTDLPRQQRRAAIWGSLLLELVGRLGLVLLFVYVVSGDQPLFTLFGMPVTVQTAGLLIAGLFLLIRNGWEMVGFFQQRHRDTESEGVHAKEQRAFPLVLLEMGGVLTIMSIDTTIAALSTFTRFDLIAAVFLISAAVRLFFVEQLAHFIQRYPALNIIILTVLVIIGLELVIQAFGFDYELPFNLIILLSIIIAVFYHRRTQPPTPETSSQGNQ